LIEDNIQQQELIDLEIIAQLQVLLYQDQNLNPDYKKVFQKKNIFNFKMKSYKNS
jgi:hypothetical protein